MVTTHSLLRINPCNRFLWPLAWHILVNFPQGVLTCSQDWEPLLSRFSHVRLCVTPETAAHQAPPYPGLSRQEHRSGLPFPPPMHESEKWKWSRSVVSDPQQPNGLQPTRLLQPWDFPGRSTGVGCHWLLRLFSSEDTQNIMLWSYARPCPFSKAFILWPVNALMMSTLCESVLYGL